MTFLSEYYFHFLRLKLRYKHNINFFLLLQMFDISDVVSLGCLYIKMHLVKGIAQNEWSFITN